MPKTIYTPREELVCGKLDEAERIVMEFVQKDDIDEMSRDLLDLLRAIRYDCERMEQKLISRKEEYERLTT